MAWNFLSRPCLQELIMEHFSIRPHSSFEIIPIHSAAYYHDLFHPLHKSLDVYPESSDATEVEFFPVLLHPTLLDQHLKSKMSQH